MLANKILSYNYLKSKLKKRFIPAVTAVYMFRVKNINIMEMIHKLEGT